MNKYPVWKYLLIVAVTALAVIYAFPNLYPEDPAVQVSHETGVIDAGLEERVRALLDEAGHAPRRIERGEGSLLARFADGETQLRAADALRPQLGPSHVVALNLAPATPDWLRSLNAAPMNLGLDLRGGVYFLLEVDTDAALKKSLDQHRGNLRATFRQEKIRYRRVEIEGEDIVVSFTAAASAEQGRDYLSRRMSDIFEVADAAADDDPLLLRLRLTRTQRAEILTLAVQQNILTLRRRVNELGVAEPVITRQGADRIAVQLPGVQDTARAKEILGATAVLEFRLVVENADAARAARTGRAPPGARLYYERSGDPVLLRRRVMLTGEHIVGASSGIDSETGAPAVHISLDSEGALIFSRVTGENVKRLMAVVFIESKSETYRAPDGELRKQTHRTEEVINIARIQEQLSKNFQITGLDSPREARKLALLLRAGALAAPMEIVEERTVGPSLGRENIERGQQSIILGFILVMLFMAVYYRLFGLVADLALVLNIVLIVAIMSLIPGATLTLPGIVGIVLTVGMAVDANVLIFERVREELRAGASAQNSIDAGYRQALSTIADANVTTLIAALVLFVFGTGPIKGFAVTLSIGIVCSMFTAIMGTRAVVNLIYGGRRRARLAV